MKWEKTFDGDWLAQGEKGHFLLWKDVNIWRGLYMHEIGRVVLFRLWDRNLKLLKKKCEENYYWEA